MVQKCFFLLLDIISVTSATDFFSKLQLGVSAWPLSEKGEVISLVHIPCCQCLEQLTFFSYYFGRMKNRKVN